MIQTRGYVLSFILQKWYNLALLLLLLFLYIVWLPVLIFAGLTCYCYLARVYPGPTVTYHFIVRKHTSSRVFGYALNAAWFLREKRQRTSVKKTLCLAWLLVKVGFVNAIKAVGFYQLTDSTITESLLFFEQTQQFHLSHFNTKFIGCHLSMVYANTKFRDGTWGRLSFILARLYLVYLPCSALSYCVYLVFKTYLL